MKENKDEKDCDRHQEERTMISIRYSRSLNSQAGLFAKNINWAYLGNYEFVANKIKRDEWKDETNMNNKPDLNSNPFAHAKPSVHRILSLKIIVPKVYCNPILTLMKCENIKFDSQITVHARNILMMEV